MIYKSEDIKKQNSIALLEKLLKMNSATMAELVEHTQFSQSLVRSILKALESKDILTVTDIEQSTGGRCPSRYSFQKDYFQVLSVFVDEGTVELVLKDIFHHVSLKEHLVCGIDDGLDKIILDITKKYEVNCIVIGASGIVQDTCFYNDHGEYMEKHDVALKLKEQVSIPVLIENDVKSMMMGIQANQKYDNLAYLYMSDTGVGSAYYMQNEIVRGHQSFSGELGLLPYRDGTVNEMIASQPDKETLEDIYLQVLMSTAVTIDPQQVILAGKKRKQLSLTHIKERMERFLSRKYELNIDVSLNPLQDALEGLHYIGILKLFDKYTDYQRR